MHRESRDGPPNRWTPDLTSTTFWDTNRDRHLDRAHLPPPTPPDPPRPIDPDRVRNHHQTRRHSSGLPPHPNCHRITQQSPAPVADRLRWWHERTCSQPDSRACVKRFVGARGHETRGASGTVLGWTPMRACPVLTPTQTCLRDRKSTRLNSSH